jgi:uncharacterized membrane protein YtjA (UPF0391 family)
MSKFFLPFLFITLGSGLLGFIATDGTAQLILKVIFAAFLVLSLVVLTIADNRT